MSELLELATQCEAAEEADRELDALIYCALHPTHTAYFSEGDEWALADWMVREGGVNFSPPCFTASLDAALTLLPAAEAGYSVVFWRLGNDGEGGDPAAFKAEVLICAMLASQRFAATAVTPALALCAAVLRARAAS